MVARGGVLLVESSRGAARSARRDGVGVGVPPPLPPTLTRRIARKATATGRSAFLCCCVCGYGNAPVADGAGDGGGAACGLGGGGVKAAGVGLGDVDDAARRVSVCVVARRAVAPPAMRGGDVGGFILCVAAEDVADGVAVGGCEPDASVVAGGLAECVLDVEDGGV